jgi:hypothetical protein
MEANAGAGVELHRGMGGGESGRGDHAGSAEARVFSGGGGVMDAMKKETTDGR